MCKKYIVYIIRDSENGLNSNTFFLAYSSTSGKMGVCDNLRKEGFSYE